MEEYDIRHKFEGPLVTLKHVGTLIETNTPFFTMQYAGVYQQFVV